MSLCNSKLNDQQKQTLYAIRIARRHNGYFKGTETNKNQIKLLFKFDDKSDPYDFITTLEAERVGTNIHLSSSVSVTVTI